MNIVSQRDPKWSNITLGTSGTIGQYGCTIDCLGYLVGLTPDKVNERMKAVGGYANGNLVIWGKVQEAIGVTCYRYTTYDNTKVQEAIASNGAVLGEVDAKAIGGTGRHWVVMTGNKMCQDPWIGKERPTSDFSFTGYTTAVFDKSKMGNYSNDSMYRGLDLTNVDSMKVCVDDHLKIVDGQLVDKSLYETLKGQFTELQKQNDSLSSQLGTVRGELSAAIGKIDSQNKIIASYVSEDAIQLETFKTAERERNEYRDFAEECLSSLEMDLKLSTSASADKESRLATIIATATSGVDLEEKYQDKIKELEEENKRLESLSKPIVDMTVGEIISQLLKTILGRK